MVSVTIFRSYVNLTDPPSIKWGFMRIMRWTSCVRGSDLVVM